MKRSVPRDPRITGRTDSIITSKQGDVYMVKVTQIDYTPDPKFDAETVRIGAIWEVMDHNNKITGKKFDFMDTDRLWRAEIRSTKQTKIDQWVSIVQVRRKG